MAGAGSESVLAARESALGKFERARLLLTDRRN